MREVTINGKSIVLESGRDLPPPIVGTTGRPKSDLRLLLEQMKPGESAFLPISTARARAANLFTMGKSIGRKFYYRAEGDGVRIWCEAGQKSSASVPSSRTASFIKRVANGASAAW